MSITGLGWECQFQGSKIPQRFKCQPLTLEHAFLTYINNTSLLSLEEYAEDSASLAQTSGVNSRSQVKLKVVVNLSPCY